MNKVEFMYNYIGQYIYYQCICMAKKLWKKVSCWNHRLWEAHDSCIQNKF